jgi:predicted enzyme related to lactoylglutathione lyase
MNLNQVTIETTQTVALARFYERLGLTLIVDSLPRYARLACPADGATLSVHFTDARDARYSPIRLYFECDDLDDRVAGLKSAGIEIDQEPVDQPWLWREAWLRDPDGNSVCLYFAGTNRLNPPWRVTP